MKKKLFVQWGAGNIGRTLMGQIFSRSGYHLICIDKNKRLVEALNTSHSYTIESISRTHNESYGVKHVTAIDLDCQEDIDEAIVHTTYMAISVGKKALAKVVNPLCRSILKRWIAFPNSPLDIIIAENIIDGSVYLRSLMRQTLPDSFPLESYVGLIETSIGKMVPLQESDDSIHLRCEFYNELYVDKEGFLNTIPQSHFIHPVSPIKAYVERKLFIHDLGHAAAAYVGHYFCPDEKYIDQVLLDVRVFNKVKSVMLQSMWILLSTYPKIFTKKELTNYIDDLLLRFTNGALQDTVYRIGRDLKRKLHYTDRIMGAIITAHCIGLCWDTIGEIFIYALSFNPLENEKTEDEQFLKEIESLPFKEKVLCSSSLEKASLSDASKLTILNILEIIAEKFN